MTVCPTESLLRRFNEGRIADHSEIDRITDHLADCNTCIDKLEAMTAGPIVQGLRDSLSDYGDDDETQMAEETIDVNAVRSNVDAVLSQVEHFADPQIDPAHLGEGHYQMIAAIGQGEFSCVFGALRRDDNTLVGIKIPHANKLTSFRHNEQFFEDCKKNQKLDHPNIQKVLEFGPWDEKRIFLSKPLIQEPTLTTVAKSGVALTTDQVKNLFASLIETIQYAHSRDVLHRHLNPNNIHVFGFDSTKKIYTPDNDQVAAISDFGFVFDSRYHFDLIEPVKTRNPFMSPESATLNAEYVDVRSDIYALGKILKLLVRVSDIKQSNPLIEQIIKKATSGRRRDRYQTVNELMSAFELV